MTPVAASFALFQIFHCGKWLSLRQQVTIVQAATGVYGFSSSKRDIGLRHKHSCLAYSPSLAFLLWEQTHAVTVWITSFTSVR